MTKKINVKFSTIGIIKATDKVRAHACFFDGSGI
jgi:hypothetical protein